MVEVYTNGIQLQAYAKPDECDSFVQDINRIGREQKIPIEAWVGEPVYNASGPAEIVGRNIVIHIDECSGDVLARALEVINPLVTWVDRGAKTMVGG